MHCQVILVGMFHVCQGPRQFASSQSSVLTCSLLLFSLPPSPPTLPLSMGTAINMFQSRQSDGSKNPGISAPEDDFEFVETPAAPSPAPESQNYGVRTTSVGRSIHFMSVLRRTNICHDSTRQSRTPLSPPTAQRATHSTTSSSSPS